jgi:hypothetical protein
LSIWQQQLECCKLAICFDQFGCYKYFFSLIFHLFTRNSLNSVGQCLKPVNQPITSYFPPLMLFFLFQQFPVTSENIMTELPEVTNGLGFPIKTQVLKVSTVPKSKINCTCLAGY